MDCHRSLADPDARVALRQVWIDLAAVALIAASELPPPTAVTRLDANTRGRAAKLVTTAHDSALAVAANGNGRSPP